MIRNNSTQLQITPDGLLQLAEDYIDRAVGNLTSKKDSILQRYVEIGNRRRWFGLLPPLAPNLEPMEAYRKFYKHYDYNWTHNIDYIYRRLYADVFLRYLENHSISGGLIMLSLADYTTLTTYAKPSTYYLDHNDWDWESDENLAWQL